MSSNCPQIPSVTIYGTTQISTTIQTISTWTSLYLGDPIVSVTTNTEISDCSANDAFGNDGITCNTNLNPAVMTVTPTLTTTLSTTINQQTIITSVVPQKTLYSSCPEIAGPNQIQTSSTLEVVHQPNIPLTTSTQAVTIATRPTTTTTAPTTAPTSTAVSDQTQTSQGNESSQSSENSIRPSSSVTNQQETSSTSILHEENSSPSHSSSTDQANSDSKQSSNLATLLLPTTPTITSIAASATSSPTAPLSIGSISQLSEIPFLGSPTTTTTSASNISNTDPIQTIASSLINPNDSNNSTSTPHHTSSHHSSGKIAGAVVGSIVGLILLCVVLVFWRRRREEQRSQGGSQVDYWERRFRDLEDPDRESGTGDTDADLVDGEGNGSGGEKGTMGDDQARRKERTKKLHLTLNLDSDKISDRPTSALSAISSFFSSRFQNEPSHRGSNLNFSRPLVRVPFSSGETTDSPPTIGRTSLGRISRFFGLGPSGISDSSPKGMRGDDETGERGGEEQERGRRMEWVRTIVDGDSVNGNHAIERDGIRSWMGKAIINTTSSGTSETSSSTKSRQVRNPTSQSRLTSIGIGPNDLNKLPLEIPSNGNGLFRSTHLGIPNPSANQEDYLNRLRNAESLMSSPPSTRLLTRIPVPKSTDDKQDEHVPNPPTPTPKPTASRNSSGRDTPRESRNSSKRAKVPDLKLSRAATTPSLWIDDELYSQFHSHEHSHTDKDKDQFLSPKQRYIAVSAFSAESVLSDKTYPYTSSGTSSSHGTITSQAPLTESFVDHSTGITNSDKSRINESDRSAVTPQLPIVQFAGSPAWGLEGWGVDAKRD